MTVSVPWRTLRSNPRTSREAELQGEEPSPEASAKASSSSEFTFDVGDLTKRLMFGGITGGVTGLAFGLSMLTPSRYPRGGSRVEFRLSPSLSVCFFSGSGWSEGSDRCQVCLLLLGCEDEGGYATHRAEW
jgi:hypothetical protein